MKRRASRGRREALRKQRKSHEAATRERREKICPTKQAMMRRLEHARTPRKKYAKRLTKGALVEAAGALDEAAGTCMSLRPSVDSHRNDDCECLQLHHMIWNCCSSLCPSTLWGHLLNNCPRGGERHKDVGLHDAATRERHEAGTRERGQKIYPTSQAMRRRLEHARTPRNKYAKRWTKGALVEAAGALDEAAGTKQQDR